MTISPVTARPAPIAAPPMKLWGNAVDTLNNNIQSLEKELKAPVEQRAAAFMGTEIRSYFRAMDTGPRMVAIQQAINDGDDITVTAVLGGKAYLSGLDPEMADSFLMEWQAKQRPVESKRLRAMKKAADLLNDRVKVLRKEWTKAVGVIEITKEGRRGEKLVVRTITPAEVREQVKAAQKPFAVPLG